jgi:hypothetical protein
MGAGSYSTKTGRRDGRDEARELLIALCAAGCHVFVDREDGQFYCSPSARAIDWPGDPEAAIEEYHDELRDLMRAATETIH